MTSLVAPPLVIPTSDGVITVFRGDLDAETVAKAALTIEAQINASREAYDDLVNVLRRAVEATGRQSASFGEIRVTLSPRSSMRCVCHHDDVRRCTKAMRGDEIVTEMVDSARYVRISRVAP